MPKIPQHIIDQVLDQCDIVDIVAEHVTLKKAGANFKACCPFHQEKTASFVVSPAKQIFHCFGCGEGGNVIGFVMKITKQNFPDSVRDLADRSGIVIAVDNTTQTQSNRYEKYFKINTYAAWLFKQNYKKSKPTQEYVASRNFSAEMIELFELGLAKDSFNDLCEFLKTKSIPEKWADELGLIRKGKNQGFYDFYRNRLMFPIKNAKGQIVGFGGRDLSGENPAKYINSPDSPIYHKSRELFGFHQAKAQISKTNQVILVEGYTDVMACFQMGFTNAVAPLGTSLTLEQVKVLKRYTTNFVLMFDGDSAGQKAALRAFDICLSQDIHPKFAILEQGQDPGDLLKADDGNDKLNHIVKSSQYALDWMFSLALKKSSSHPQKKTNYLRSLLTWIEKSPDVVLKNTYRQKLSQYFEISSQDLEKIVEIQIPSGIETKSVQRAPSIMDHVIAGVLLHPEWLNDDNQYGQWFEWIENERVQKGLLDLKNNAKNNETFSISHAISQMDENLQKLFTQAAASVESVSESVFKDCLQKLKKQYRKLRLKQITAEILEAETNKNDARKKELLKQKQSLLANQD